MSVQWKSMARAAAVAGAAAIVGIAPIAMKAQAPPPGAQAPGGGGGRGGSPLGGQLFTAFDADKDGSVTAAELKTVFDGWYDAADTQKSGSVSQEQLSTALNAALGEPAAPAAGAPGGRGAGGAGAGRGATEFVAGASTPGLNDACGGRSQQPTAPCVSDVEQMMAALPNDRTGQAGEGPQGPDLLAHPLGGIPALVHPAGGEGGGGARQEDGRVDLRYLMGPGRVHDREPEAVRRDLPVEHDGLLPGQGWRQGGDGRPPRGLHRVRAQRQGSGRHPCDRRLVSLAVPERRAAAGAGAAAAAAAGTAPAARWLRSSFAGRGASTRRSCRRTT